MHLHHVLWLRQFSIVQVWWFNYHIRIKVVSTCLKVDSNYSYPPKLYDTKLTQPKYMMQMHV